MLANKMSNQDEDEVEDELEALEAELSGVKLPDAPKERIVLSEDQQEDFRKEMQKERRLKRQQEREADRSAQPMLA